MTVEGAENMSKTVSTYRMYEKVKERIQSA